MTSKWDNPPGDNAKFIKIRESAEIAINDNGYIVHASPKQFSVTIKRLNTFVVRTILFYDATLNSGTRIIAFGPTHKMETTCQEK